MTSTPPRDDYRELAIYGIELSHMCDSPEEGDLIDRHLAESQVYALLDIADAIREQTSQCDEAMRRTEQQNDELTSLMKQLAGQRLTTTRSKFAGMGHNPYATDNEVLS